MVNWNSRLLIQKVTTVIMVSIHALCHCFGVSAFIGGSRSPGHHEQIKFGWEVETLIYSDEGRCLHRRWSGSAKSKPCTTYWRCSRHINIHTRSYGFEQLQASGYTKLQVTPWNEQAFQFTICRWWVRPACELKEIQLALCLRTLLPRVHTPAHALSRSGLQRA